MNQRAPIDRFRPWRAARPDPTRRRRRAALGALLMMMALPAAPGVVADSEPARWTDDELVASYRDLESRGELEAAVRAPALPDDPPRFAFLDALAWYAAGAPDRAGTLTIEQLDRFMQSQILAYMRLLEAKVTRGEENDYGRTRTWKVIQKLTLLRRAMSGPRGEGRYAYPAITRAPDGDDPWEREHTLGSPEVFREKVCRASYEHPVLVKFGNTNCTQCMLFEMIGSVKEFWENPAHKGTVEVYKVWWGLRPDDSFAGKIRNPERLDELVRAEGVRSSPAFIVYRNGRRYPCEGAFPDERGMDERLESCLRQEFGEAPMAGVCLPDASSRG